MVCDPGIESGGVPDIQTRRNRAQHRDGEAEHQHDEGKDDLPRTLLAEAAEELRPDAEADREQKHQEEGRT